MQSSQRKIGACLAVVIVAGCNPAGDAVLAPKPYVDPTYDIYSVVLDTLFLGNASSRAGARFIVRNRTQGGGATGREDFEYAAAQFQETHPEAFGMVKSLFMSSTLPAITLDAASFHVGAPVQLVTPDEVSSERLGANYWEGFYQRFPGARGLITLGTPVVDQSGRYAFLGYGHGCGYLCADYGYILLEKRQTGWVILRRVVTVVS